MNTKIKKEFVEVFFGIAIIMGYFIYIASKSFAPYGWDENGYIAQLLLTNGIDISDVSRQLPYYSFGNGLINIVLPQILSNEIFLYKSLILFNGVLNVITYLICYYFCTQLLSPNMKFAFLVSLIVTIRPDMITLGNVYLSESYISAFFWMLLLFLYKFCQTEKFIYEFLFGIFSVYLFFIHQRMIAVSLIGLLIILYFCISKKNKNAYITILVMFIICVLLWKYKTYSKSVLLTNGILDQTTNDFIPANNIIRAISEPAFFIRLIKTIIGKLWYFIVESFGMNLLGFTFILKRLKKTTVTNWLSQETSLFIYLLITFCGTMLITSYYIQYPGRVDHIIMSRYLEPITGPILMCGIIAFLSYSMSIKQVVYGIIALMLFFSKVVEAFADETLKRVNINLGESNPMISMFVNNPYVIGDYIKIAAAFIGVCLVFIFLSRKRRYIMVLCLLVVFSLTDFYLLKQKVSANDLNKESVMAILNELDYKKNIYCVKGNLYANELKYLENDLHIYILDKITQLPNDEECYFILPKSKMQNVQGYEVILETQECILFKHD